MATKRKATAIKPKDPKRDVRGVTPTPPKLPRNLSRRPLVPPPMENIKGDRPPEFA